MARTQEDRKADTRRRLLDAAAELFARAGFHAVSADAVADAADRTSGSVYAHFGGKEGLLLALLDDWEAGISEQMRAVLAPDHGRLQPDRVHTLWDAFAASTATGRTPDGLLLEHELWLHAARSPELGPAVATRYAAGREAMGRHFATWDARPTDPAPADLAPGELGTLVLALLLGLEMQRRLDPDAVPDRIAVEGLRRLLDSPVKATFDPAFDPQSDR